MKKLPIFLISLLLFPFNIMAADVAYVAKQDGKMLYLDTTELKEKLTPGSVLKIVAGSEELKNHKGQSLGKIYKYGPSVKVTRVEEKYAIAQLPVDYGTNPGTELHVENILAAPKSPMPPRVLLPASAPAQERTTLLYKSAPVREKFTSSVMFDIAGKKYVAAASSKSQVKLFSVDGTNLKEVSDYSFQTSKEVIALSAGDIKGSGAPQIYAVIFEEKDSSANTAVLEFAEGKLKNAQNMKWVARVTSTPNGPELLGHEIYKYNDIRTTPVGRITYNAKKEKYEYKRLPLTSNSNASSLAFNYYDFDGDSKPDALIANQTGGMKVLFSKGKNTDVGDGDYASTPKRMSFGGRVYRALLPIEYMGQDGGHAVFAAAQNAPKVGIVADTFALYKGGSVDFMAWDGLTFKTMSSIKTDGVIYDLNAVNFNGAQGILVTEVYDSGNTVLEVYSK